MRIGLDLDNTIICYDGCFQAVARNLGLISSEVGASKNEVKDAIQKLHGNDVWTELQGEVYGPHILLAQPYAGALEFMQKCRAAGHDVHVLSHKTQFPARGTRFDLRQAALNWLEKNGWFESGGISGIDVEFHESRQAKVEAISHHQCDVFVDDLPEVFAEAHFPAATTQILFNPARALSARQICVQSWDEIRRAIFFEEIDELSRDIQRQSTELLNTIGISPARTIFPMKGGRNNKVFRLGTVAGDLLFKSYFHHPKDTRDRLSQEMTFLRHLQRTGGDLSARPLAANAVEHVAIMEFLHGVRPRESEIDLHHIEQAIAFIRATNRDLNHPETRAIPVASEACFTVRSHIATAQKRVDRLAQILNEDEVDAQAIAFVTNELVPRWQMTRQSILAHWSDAELEAVLSQEERCLSPSDFGFHNSLRTEDGKLRFLDFEYAGWDDPAKLVIDFANQPDMLLDRALTDQFKNALLELNAHPKALARRIESLESLYQIKWACICLNNFLEFGRTRTQFTEGRSSDEKKIRESQLIKARIMLERVEKV